MSSCCFALRMRRRRLALPPGLPPASSLSLSAAAAAAAATARACVRGWWRGSCLTATTAAAAAAAVGAAGGAGAAADTAAGSQLALGAPASSTALLSTSRRTEPWRLRGQQQQGSALTDCGVVPTVRRHPSMHSPASSPSGDSHVAVRLALRLATQCGGQQLRALVGGTCRTRWRARVAVSSPPVRGTASLQPNRRETLWRRPRKPRRSLEAAESFERPPMAAGALPAAPAVARCSPGPTPHLVLLRVLAPGRRRPAAGRTAGCWRCPAPCRSCTAQTPGLETRPAPASPTGTPSGRGGAERVGGRPLQGWWWLT